MNASDTLTRYRAAIADPPPRGAGLGHRWLLSVANLAARAGVDIDQAAADLHHARPDKPSRDIRAAVLKAYGEVRTYTPPPQPRRRPLDTTQFWRRTLAPWRDVDPFVELWERSPRRLHGAVSDDPALLVSALYAPDEHIYIGEKYAPGIPGHNLRTAGEWADYFAAGGKPGPFICPNPLTGAMAETKDNKPSYRCDAAIAAYRYCVIEFDNRPKHDQACFWLRGSLPLVALIDSGGKSLHGWIRLDAADADEWDREVRPHYRGVLADLGADVACQNPGRLSRMPGVPRGADVQRLLFLNPEAGQ